MHLIHWAAYAAFAATSVAMLVTITSLRSVMQELETSGRRTRRLKLRRMGVVVGLWQISTGLCILALPGPHAWTGSIGLFGMGGMFLAGSWLSRKTGFASWWVPE